MTSFKKLIALFEEQAGRTNLKRGRNLDGGGPECPMLTVIAGGSRDEVQSVMQRRFVSLWPRYRADLKFLHLAGRDRSRPKAADAFDTAFESEVENDVSSLFDRRTKWDTGQLRVFYVINTDGMKNPEEYERLMADITRLDGLIRRVSRAPVINMATVMIGRGYDNRVVASYVNSYFLRRYGDKDKADIFDGVLLLCSQRANNSSFATMRPVFRAAAFAVSVAASGGSRGAMMLRRKKVMTAAWARREIPLGDIGYSVVSGIKENIQNALFAGKEISVSSLVEECAKRRRKISDDRARRVFLPLLPDERKFTFFPRGRRVESYTAAGMSFDEFDKLTLGSLKLFINEISGKEAAGIFLSGSKEFDDITERFLEFLKENMNITRKLSLSSSERRFSEALAKREGFSMGPGIKERCLGKLQDNFYRGVLNRQIFTRAAEVAGDRAREVSRRWDAFIDSEMEVRPPTQEIVSHYEKFVDRYFKEKDRIRRLDLDMKNISSEDDLERFLSSVAENIAIYISDKAGRSADRFEMSDERILDDLSDENTVIMFPHVTNRSYPILNAVMIRDKSYEEKIKNSLNLNKDTVFYLRSDRTFETARILKVYEMEINDLER